MTVRASMATRGQPRHLAPVKAAAGEDTWLEAFVGRERFDVLPLLAATDGAVATFGRDVRRLRPNILISGVQGLDETHWPGAELRIGDAIVRLAWGWGDEGDHLPIVSSVHGEIPMIHGQDLTARVQFAHHDHGRVREVVASHQRPHARPMHRQRR